MARSAKYERLGEDTNTSISAESRTKLNIALVGARESGKSSFINAIQRVNEDDPDTIKISFEPTKESKRYALRTNSTIILWDHPGFSENDYETYWKKFLLKEFNGFLYFIGGRYRKEDTGFVKQLSWMGKPFLIIRTKIDNDIRPAVMGTDQEKETLKKIKANVLELFRNHYNGDVNDIKEKIFVINNYGRDNPNWDFNRLSNAILTNFQRSLISSCEVEEDDSRRSELEDMKSKARKEFKECAGYKELSEKIIQNIEGWREVKIKIAVIGQSGVGKTSFINAFRGLKLHDGNAARTGPTETTTELTSYAFPGNKRVELIDIPGVSSPKYPDVHTYSKEIDFQKYDVFVIVHAVRFLRDDKNLVTLTTLIKKPFFFVRTKIDVDLRNEKATKKNLVEKDMLTSIRGDVTQNLGDLISKEDPIFLISSHFPTKWDFPKLVTAIRESLPESKKTAFVFSTDIFSKEHLKVKVEALKENTLWRTLKSLFKFSERGRIYNLDIIKEKVDFSLDQLKLPKNADSDQEFTKLSPELKERMKKFFLTQDVTPESYLKIFDRGERRNILESSDQNSVVLKAIAGGDYPWLFKTPKSRTDLIHLRYSLNCLFDEMAEVYLMINFEKLGEGV